MQFIKLIKYYYYVILFKQYPVRYSIFTIYIQNQVTTTGSCNVYTCFMNQNCKYATLLIGIGHTFLNNINITCFYHLTSKATKLAKVPLVTLINQYAGAAMFCNLTNVNLSLITGKSN